MRSYSFRVAIARCRGSSFSKRCRGSYQLDQEIEKIMQNSSIGEEKKGDLRGVYVHKFKIKTIQYLLSYRMVDLGLGDVGRFSSFRGGGDGKSVVGLASYENRQVFSPHYA